MTEDKRGEVWLSHGKGIRSPPPPGPLFHLAEHRSFHLQSMLYPPDMMNLDNLLSQGSSSSSSTYRHRNPFLRALPAASSTPTSSSQWSLSQRDSQLTPSDLPNNAGGLNLWTSQNTTPRFQGLLPSSQAPVGAHHSQMERSFQSREPLPRDYSYDSSPRGPPSPGRRPPSPPFERQLKRPRPSDYLPDTGSLPQSDPTARGSSVIGTGASQVPAGIGFGSAPSPYDKPETGGTVPSQYSVDSDRSGTHGHQAVRPARDIPPQMSAPDRVEPEHEPSRKPASAGSKSSSSKSKTSPRSASTTKPKTSPRSPREAMAAFSKSVVFSKKEWDFGEAASDMMFNAGSTYEGLDVMKEMIEKHGAVAIALVWGDLTTSLSVRSKKYCTPSKPCDRSNCSCERHCRADRASASLTGAVIRLGPLHEEQEHDDDGVAIEQETEEATCFFLPLERCESEVDEEVNVDSVKRKSDKNRIILPIRCETTLQGRWEAFLDILAADCIKIIFNAQLALMPFTRDINAPAGVGRVTPEISNVFDPKVAMWLYDTAGAETDSEMGMLCSRLCPLEWKEAMEKAKAHRGGGSVAEVILQTAEALAPLFTVCHTLVAKLMEAGAEETFKNVEMPLIPVLSAMEATGICFDSSKLKGLSQMLESKINALTDSARRACGVMDLNPCSPQQVASALYGKLKLQAPPGGDRHSPTNEAALKLLAGAHPIVPILLEHRNVSKIKSTYVEPFLKFSKRIYPQWNHFNARTGRLTCSRPNLQQIPNHGKDIEIDALDLVMGTDEDTTSVVKLLRSAFTASAGCVLVSADYSQIEMRVLAYMCKDPGLAVLFSKEYRGDIYRELASKVYDKQVADITDVERKTAKVVCLGTIYGLGSASAAQQLGMEENAVKLLIKSFLRSYPGIKRFTDTTVEGARNSGSVRTLAGRRRLLPEINSPQGGRKAQAQRQAISSVIQGTAADIIKCAMVIVDRAILKWETQTEMQDAEQEQEEEREEPSGLQWPRLCLQIHDELVYNCPVNRVEKLVSILREQMTTSVCEVLDIHGITLEVNVTSGFALGDMAPVTC